MAPVGAVAQSGRVTQRCASACRRGQRPRRSGSAVLRRSCVWPRIDEIAAWSIGGSTSTSTESRNEHRMKRIVRPGIFFWIFVAALAPLDEGRGDNCFERCASALGGQDAVSASIYDNCLNSCRAGASQQESVRFAALAMSLASLRSGSSHGQNSESDAQQLALKNCATVASDCKLVNWGYNLCFALATSQPDGRYGRGVDSDRARAVNQALGLCRGAGGKNCI